MIDIFSQVFKTFVFRDNQNSEISGTQLTPMIGFLGGLSLSRNVPYCQRFQFFSPENCQEGKRGMEARSQLGLPMATFFRQLSNGWKIKLGPGAQDF